METLKIIGAIVSLMLGFICSIILPIWFFDSQDWKKQMQCKEVGGQYIYQDYKWICN